ncbi:hypothetical protein JCM3774_001140 [Rhodotorula dairenensis]
MPSFASTRLVNPPGVEPVLSVQQVWRGLQRKAREPKRFVPAISECRVHREEGNKVRGRSSTTYERNGGGTTDLLPEVRFGDGTPEMREEITAFDNCIVYFETTSASLPARPDSDPDLETDPHRTRITNTISHGPENELFLTFTFAPRMPHLSDDKAAQMTDEEINAVVGNGVQQTVDVIREMVRAGEL